MVTIYIVQDMSEDVWGDVMQGDNWGVSRGYRLLTLSKVVIQKSPEVVTAPTEESLVAEEAGVSHTEADIRAAAKAIRTWEGQLSKVTPQLRWQGTVSQQCHICP